MYDGPEAGCTVEDMWPVVFIVTSISIPGLYAPLRSFSITELEARAMSVIAMYVYVYMYVYNLASGVSSYLYHCTELGKKVEQGILYYFALMSRSKSTTVHCSHQCKGAIHRRSK